MPDGDDALGAAEEPGGEEEAAPGSGPEDDADEEEKDEHPLSSGDSAIEAATIVNHPPSPRRAVLHPSMPHLYPERAINLNPERRRQSSQDGLAYHSESLSLLTKGSSPALSGPCRSGIQFHICVGSM